jgi:hypothetical protein
MLSCVGYQLKTSVWNPLVIGPFLSMEVLCDFARYQMVVIIGDRVGQLEERGEYWMGRKGSGLIWNLETQGGRPRLSWLRTDSLCLVSKFELCTGAYGISCGPTNWVASCAAKMEAILLCLMGVQWDSAWATHSVSIEAYEWNTCTRVRWAMIVALTTSWTVVTHGALRACVCHVVRLFPLQGWLFFQISAITLRYG